MFISYRRGDSPYAVLWIYEKLKQHYAQAPVLRSMDDAGVGPDFRTRLAEAIAASRAVVAVIGDRWIEARENHDLMEFELQTALSHNVPILPVLVDSAAMPPADKLPDSLQVIAELTPIEFRAGKRFRKNLDAIVEAVEAVLNSAVESVPATSDPSPAPVDSAAETVPEESETETVLLDGESPPHDHSSDMKTVELPDPLDVTVELPEGEHLGSPTGLRHHSDHLKRAKGSQG